MAQRAAVHHVTVDLPDLTDEAQAERWIRTRPDSFCNTNDRGILSQVLNDYDQETTDFYRWQVDYTQEQLAALISSKLQVDLGEIVDLVPMERGKSGRIVTLKMVGTKRTLMLLQSAASHDGGAAATEQPAEQ